MKIRCLVYFIDKRNGFPIPLWYKFPKSWIHVYEVYHPHMCKYINELLPYIEGFRRDSLTGYVKLPEGPKLNIINIDLSEFKKIHLHIHKIYRWFPIKIEIKS